MSYEETLAQIEKAGGMARVNAIAFLRYFKYEDLTTEQLMKILKIVQKGKKGK